MDESLIILIFASAIRAGTSLLYATIGEILTERAGILNIGLEGIMLMGAMIGLLVDYNTGNIFLAISLAALSGCLLSAIHGYFSIWLRTNQIAVGLAIVFLGSGISAFFGAAYVGKKITGVSDWSLPLLKHIPVIGKIFFQHDIFVYLSYFLVISMYIFLYKTKWGFIVRAVGEDPKAAKTQGINILGVRFICVIIGGGLAAVGGAHLSLSYTHMWVADMTAGRGWIAVALVIFSIWNPWRALLGAYLFGGLISLQLHLQASGISISSYILSMIPYIVTIGVLCFTTWRLKYKRHGMPASLGVPYEDE